MGQTVYADLLFLVNFSMDFLCFFITVRLLRRPFKVLRCLLAAAIGGVYSVAILFVNMNVILGLVADLGFCIVMCLCAYGIKGKRTDEFLLHTAVYFGVSMGIGGCMTAMYSLLNRIDLPLGEVESNPDGISVWLFGLLAIVSGLAAMLGGEFFKNTSNDTVSEVEIAYMGKKIKLRGMTDTGNMLKDPISGKSVIVIDSAILLPLLSEACIGCALKGDIGGVMNESEGHKVRLVPINTASGSSVICAFVPEKITVCSLDKNGKSKENKTDIDALFAPAVLKLSNVKKAEGCSALIPGDINY